MNADRVLVVIPARLHSTRLPRKVLLRETGRYLMQHVYERALAIRSADEVVIAADHSDVARAAESFGAAAVMTSPDHPSGTDRAAEVARLRPATLVVNLQADEPEMEPEDVEALIAGMRRSGAEMGTLVHLDLSEADQGDPSVVKAVVDGRGWARDFRREPTPGARRHLGIYAYRGEFLQRFTNLAPTVHEQSRRLEQMRALDHGIPILAISAAHNGVGIDTPEDYAAFVRRWHDS